MKKELTNVINIYLQESIIDKKAMKSFCCEMFSIEKRKIEDCVKGKIKFRVISFPYASNGWMKIRKKEEYHFEIVENIFSYLRNTGLHNHMKLFYLYTTLLHEIEHMKIFLKIGYEEQYSYTYILAYLEQTKARDMMIGEWIEAEIYRKKKRKNYMKSYYTSSAEILCCLKSLKGAYSIFKIYMSEEEKRIIERMIAAFDFLNKNLEIGYKKSGMPYNKFFNMLIKTHHGINRNRKGYARDLIPQIFLLYDEEVKLKSMEQIYKTRDNINKDFIDHSLLMIFVGAKNEFFEEFEKNPNLKLHIEYLVNQYFEKCMEYFLHQEITEIFEWDEILRDNNTVIMNNIKHLNKQIQKYGMTCRGGICPVSI